MMSRLAYRVMTGSRTSLPAICAVDVAVAQGAAFQHAELVEQEDRVITGAVEMPVPGGPFLIAMGGADRAVHVQHDVLQPVRSGSGRSTGRSDRREPPGSSVASVSVSNRPICEVEAA